MRLENSPHFAHGCGGIGLAQMANRKVFEDKIECPILEGYGPHISFLQMDVKPMILAILPGFIQLLL